MSALFLLFMSLYRELTSLLVHSMLDFQKAKGLMEISMLMFAFYTVVTERQEQDAIEWHVSEREGNILHSLSAARFGENPDFSC